MPPTFWRAFAGPLCIAVAIIGLLALVLRDHAETDRSNADAQARARAHAVILAAQAASLDSARTALVKKQAVFFHSDTSFVKIRDSVFVPVTHAETVAVLDKLPSFLTATDSMHRACTELVESCAVFRVRAESSLAGLTADRDLWKGIAESQRPSRWAPVREWALRIGIAYGAFRLGQAAR